jgi:hypothetical protein
MDLIEVKKGVKDQKNEMDDFPIHSGTKPAIEIKFKKELMDSSEFEIIEIKDENIELVDVPIQNGIKSVNEVELDKDLKDNSDVGSIIDEVIDQLELSDLEKSYCAVCQVEVPFKIMDVHSKGKKHNRKLTDQENYYFTYCSLCESFQCLSDLEKHLNGTKHNRRLKYKEKSTMSQINANDFIITDPTQIPYYCALCQISNVCQDGLEKHLAGKKHKDKAKTMDNTENVKNPYYCALCDLQGNS